VRDELDRALDTINMLVLPVVEPAFLLRDRDGFGVDFTLLRNHLLNRYKVPLEILDEYMLPRAAGHFFKASISVESVASSTDAYSLSDRSSYRVLIRRSWHVPSDRDPWTSVGLKLLDDFWQQRAVDEYFGIARGKGLVVAPDHLSEDDTLWLMTCFQEQFRAARGQAQPGELAAGVTEPS
jgi:hypothetical protein